MFLSQDQTHNINIIIANVIHLNLIKFKSRTAIYEALIIIVVHFQCRTCRMIGIDYVYKIALLAVCSPVKMFAYSSYSSCTTLKMSFHNVMGLLLLQIIIISSRVQLNQSLQLQIQSSNLMVTELSAKSCPPWKYNNYENARSVCGDTLDNVKIISHR